MKLKAIFALLLMFVSACDRRPAHKDLPNRSASDHNSMDHSKMSHSEMQSSPNAAAAPYELQFIDTMIAHHQGAIDMAQLAPTRAGHAELKRLAAGIVSDQQKEIGQMRAWRDQYFKGSPVAMNMDLPGMRDGMKGMDISKLDRLKENAFDLEFIRQMVPHHEGAIVMARDAVTKLAPADPAKTAELAEIIRNFAHRIVDAQSAEIKQMKEWESAWSK